MMNTTSTKTQLLRTPIVLVLLVVMVLAAMMPPVMAATQRQLQGQEEICFEGFVMDNFCIQRGTLLDNPSVRTLEEPNRHSLHCLVDISRCVNSGYEMLMDPTEETNGLYSRALRLNDAGNQMAISLARRSGQRGFCSTCTTELDNQAEGFRAAIRGVIVPNSGVPATVDVMEVLPAGDGCGLNMTMFVPENVTTDLGGSDGAMGIDPVTLHGSLMSTAWGFLLPTGVLSARFLRHRSGGLWFMAHRICNTVGYLVAIAGIIVAFRNFGNVFEDGMGPSYRHGIIGLTTMACGFLQILAGVLRPHLPEDEKEAKSTIRFVWEIGHKALGYSTIVIAYATLWFGAEVAGIQQDTFRGVFYSTLAYAGVLSAVLVADKCSRDPMPEGSGAGVDHAAGKEMPIGNGDHESSSRV